MKQIPIGWIFPLLIFLGTSFVAIISFVFIFLDYLLVVSVVIVAISSVSEHILGTAPIYETGSITAAYLVIAVATCVGWAFLQRVAFSRVYVFKILACLLNSAFAVMFLGEDGMFSVGVYMSTGFAWAFGAVYFVIVLAVRGRNGKLVKPMPQSAEGGMGDEVQHTFYGQPITSRTRCGEGSKGEAFLNFLENALPRRVAPVITIGFIVLASMLLWMHLSNEREALEYSIGANHMVRIEEVAEAYGVSFEEAGLILEESRRFENRIVGIFWTDGGFAERNPIILSENGDLVFVSNGEVHAYTYSVDGYSLTAFGPYGVEHADILSITEVESRGEITGTWVSFGTDTHRNRGSLLDVTHEALEGSWHARGLLPIVFDGSGTISNMDGTIFFAYELRDGTIIVTDSSGTHTYEAPIFLFECEEVGRHIAMRQVGGGLGSNPNLIRIFSELAE